MRFIETPVFTEDIERELSLEEYRKLQLTLLFRPAQGNDQENLTPKQVTTLRRLIKEEFE